VIYADGRATKRFAGRLDRVLVVDPQPAATRLVHELLKDLGARAIIGEANPARALVIARKEEPQIVICEYTGPDFNGPEFVRALRRSDMACRQVPVIMVTSEATAASITAARDAGVHEFLKKPFTIKDLTRRIEAVTLKTRDWVEAVRYIGPDRRRFNSGDYAGPRKRKSDAQTSDSARVEQALRIMRSALQAIDSDPHQAMRSMLAQAGDLTRAGVALGDTALTTAAAGLQACLNEVAETGRFNRPRIEAACLPLWVFLPPDAATAAA
jgi:DNA-binding response OmpR family regulator